MSEWKETTLGEISEKVQYGYTESAAWEPIGPKFLRITDIQEDFINWDKVPFCKISESDFEKYKLDIGDVCVARTGNSTGATTVIKKNIDAVFASYLIRFKLDKKIADYRFIDFLLRSQKWKGFVNSVKSGSAQDGANAQAFSLFPVFLPSLPEQQSIAAILSSLDNKIGLLRRQNQTLEQLAQTIFKQWFVHYQYPGATGEMVLTELGDEPKGWRVSPISKIISVQNGYAFKSEDFKEKGDVGILKIRNISNQIVDITRTDFVSNEVANSIDKKFRASSGSMLIAMTGAEVAKIGIVTNTTKELMINQRVGMFIDKVEYGKLFCYLLLTQESYQKILRDKGSGSSAQPNISSSDIESVEFVIPSEDVLVQFGEIVNPLFKKLCQSLDEIQTLTQLRDSLLPRLMSGKLRVG